MTPKQKVHFIRVQPDFEMTLHRLQHAHHNRDPTSRSLFSVYK